MALFYSQSTGGFYDDAIHKTMPDDVVSITVEEWQALLAAQATGQVIQADSNGNPVAVAPPAPTADQVIKNQIAALEATVTQRRVREAVLGTDSGWLAGVNTQIATLRATLT